MKSSWSHSLNNRPEFSNIKAAETRICSKDNSNWNYNDTHNIPTANHPTVYIPTSQYVPPGLATEMVWECVYGRLPRRLLRQLNRDDDEFDQPIVNQSQYHENTKEKRHYTGLTIDHVGALMDSFEPAVAKSHSKIKHSSGNYFGHDHWTSDSNFKTKNKTLLPEAARLRSLWSDVKNGLVRVDDFKAEISRLRNQADNEDQDQDGGSRLKNASVQVGDGSVAGSVAKTAIAAIAAGTERSKEEGKGKERKIVKTGYDKTIKSKSFEGLRRLNDDSVWQKMCHERGVADIGYGRIGRGGRMEAI
ncbi:hypothetical protein HK100_003588 [Physocladia obscura]|uniref:Uncharacterized protein n=1 Tax=Physocladia obscura TaxID=109957 RepID=A0AAD5SWS0_9FUNG|nr:hypothetical protein HK100_003588 [Physocladia obscura]